MEDFDDFIGRDLKVFGVDQAFIEKLKWMDQFVLDEVRKPSRQGLFHERHSLVPC